MTHKISTEANNSEKINFLIGFLLLLIACALVAGKFSLPKRENALLKKDIVSFKIACNDADFIGTFHATPPLANLFNVLKEQP